MVKECNGNKANYNMLTHYKFCTHQIWFVQIYTFLQAKIKSLPVLHNILHISIPEAPSRRPAQSSSHVRQSLTHCRILQAHGTSAMLVPSLVQGWLLFSELQSTWGLFPVPNANHSWSLDCYACATDTANTDIDVNRPDQNHVVVVLCSMWCMQQCNCKKAELACTSSCVCDGECWQS